MSDTLLDTLLQGNKRFEGAGFHPELKMMPSSRLLVLGCVDPRVDPEQVLGLAPGQAAVIRNVGGRVTPPTLDTLAMLRKVTQAAGGDLAAGWNLVVLHHTDCGIKRLAGAPELLAHYFGVPQTELPGCFADDPHAAVARDIEALRASELLAGELVVSGLVYDVEHGTIERVVPASRVRP